MEKKAEKKVKNCRKLLMSLQFYATEYPSHIIAYTYVKKSHLNDFHFWTFMTANIFPSIIHKHSTCHVIYHK